MPGQHGTHKKEKIELYTIDKSVTRDEKDERRERETRGEEKRKGREDTETDEMTVESKDELDPWEFADHKCNKFKFTPFFVRLSSTYTNYTVISTSEATHSIKHYHSHSECMSRWGCLREIAQLPCLLQSFVEQQMRLRLSQELSKS